MKKLVLVFVAVAAMSFASCSNKAAQPAATDGDSIAAVADSDSMAADSLVGDSAAVEAPAAE